MTPGSRWIKVDATIVECFRAWGEPTLTPRPLFEIVADVEIPRGGVERHSWHQRLHTLSHHWRAPDPGEVVQVKWDPVHRRLRLDLSGDLRFDEKLIRKVARTREAPTWPPTGVGGGT